MPSYRASRYVIGMVHVDPRFRRHPAVLARVRETLEAVLATRKAEHGWATGPLELLEGPQQEAGAYATIDGEAYVAEHVAPEDVAMVEAWLTALTTSERDGYRTPPAPEWVR